MTSSICEALTVKQLRSIVHSSELTIMSQFLQANKVRGRQAAAFCSNVPLSIQYKITDDAMTTQFKIGANDVEGYDAIVGQAAWLGLRLRHWPLPFLSARTMLIQAAANE